MTNPDGNQASKHIHCQHMERYCNESSWLIDYDSSLNEFTLSSKDGRFRAILYYCFHCGEPLSPSLRHEQYKDITEDDLIKIREIVGNSTTINDYILRLGHPDEVIDSDTHADGLASGLPSGTRYYIYSRVVSSGDVILIEYPTGAVEYVVRPKLKDE